MMESLILSKPVSGPACSYGRTTRWYLRAGFSTEDSSRLRVGRTVGGSAAFSVADELEVSTAPGESGSVFAATLCDGAGVAGSGFWAPASAVARPMASRIAERSIQLQLVVNGPEAH